MLENDLRVHREKAGLTQHELARRCGVSRQTVNALEAGRFTPATTLALRLARVLRCRVEDLFRLDDEAEPIGDVVLAPGADGPSAAGPAVLAHVGDRWVAHRLAPDAVLPGNARIEAGSAPARAHRATVVPLVPRELLDHTLLVAGCAPALAVLSQRVSERNPGSFVPWIDATSTHALDLLHAGLVHVAGAHLLDEATGEFNRPIIASCFPGRRMDCVTLARWEQGIVLRAADRPRIRAVDDLLQPGLRLARREPGAGAEKLLARLLAQRGCELPPAAAPLACGHLGVARQVASGAADAGVAVRAVALAFGLDFIPLAEERFDLVLPAELADDARVVRLLDLLSGRAFRGELAALGGYDTTQTGDAFVVESAA
jgi:molybdate-binding protein/DNA-binding XRE family transcriptional regulator